MVLKFLKNENGNVKIVVAVAIALVILVITVICIINLNKSKIVTDIEEQAYEYFILYSKDGTKTGVVDKNGKELIKLEYDYIYIPNQAEPVFFCFKGEEYSIFNEKGNDIFKDYENVYPIVVSDTTLEMEKKVLSYEKDGKYGLVDYKGKKLTDAIYDSVSSLPNKPGTILVKEEGLYGIVDSNAKIIIEPKYNSIKGDEYSTEKDGYSKTGYIITEKTNSGIIYGYIDYTGKVLVEPKYESISRILEYDTDDIFLMFMENGKKGIIKNKKVLIKPKYQSISYYNVSDIFIVGKNEKYGAINADGDEILKTDYTSYVVAGNYISVRKNDEMRLYDLHGNLVNTNTYKSIIETENESYFIAIDESGYYSIISKDVQIDKRYTNIIYAFDNFFIYATEDGQYGILNVYTGTEVEPSYDYINIVEGARALEAKKGNIVDIYSENIEKVLTIENGIIERINTDYTAIYSNSELKYISNKGEVANNTEVYKDLKLYSYQAEDGKWGYVNSEGKIVVDCKYDIVTELNEYGFAGICQEGKWGVIDENGKVIVVPSYELETYYFPKFIGKYQLEKLDDIHCIKLED